MSRVKKASAGKKATTGRKATAGKQATAARDNQEWTDTERSHVMFWKEDEQKRKNGLQETQGRTGYARAEADLGRSNLSLRLCMAKLRSKRDPRALVLKTFDKQTASKDPAALRVWKAAFDALPESPTLAAPPSLLPAVPTTLAAPSSLLPAVSTTPVPSPPSAPPSLSWSLYSDFSVRSTQTPVIAPGTPSRQYTPPPNLSTSVSSTPSSSSTGDDAIRSEPSSTERDLSIQPKAKLWHSSQIERFSSEVLVQIEGALLLMDLAGMPEPSSDQIFHGLIEADRLCQSVE